VDKEEQIEESRCKTEDVHFRVVNGEGENGEKGNSLGLTTPRCDVVWVEETQKVPEWSGRHGVELF